MKTSTIVLTSGAIFVTNSIDRALSFNTSFFTSSSWPPSSRNHPLSQSTTTFSPLSSQIDFLRFHTCSSTTALYAGGWGNNQERSLLNEEFGGVNGAPIYDTYEIEDRGQFMKRVNEERKSLRIKKAADLLEVARIAGVELKRKEKDPEKLNLFDAEDLKSSEDDEYLDVSI